jgi:ketosteroid isomerase-like protein
MNQMKTSLINAVIVFILLATITPASVRARRAAARPAQDAEFKALIDGYYAAWSTLDPNNAAKYYARDADLVFFDIAPLKYNGWSEYKEGVVKNFTSQASSGSLKPNNDLKVTRHGTIAWTTVTFHLSVKLKAGGGMEVEARHTAIWEKRGGQWLIVHEHVSAPIS